MPLIGQKCCGNCAHYKILPAPFGDGQNRFCTVGPMITEQLPHLYRLIPPGERPDMPAGGAEVVAYRNMVVPRLSHPDYVCGDHKSIIVDPKGGIAN